MDAIGADRAVSAPPEAVFAFLADLENHVRLAPGLVDVVWLERREGLGTHAFVSLRGPLGVRRVAMTEIVDRTPTSLIAGEARIGRRTRVAVTWTIADRPPGSMVSLSAAIERASPLDALLLAAGGRRWIAKRFDVALENLAEQVAGAAA